MADPKHSRRAALDDVPVIFDVLKDNPEEVLPRSVPDIMSNFDRFYVYDDGGIKGVVSWQVLPIINFQNPDRCLEVVSFSVSKDHQGRDIGTLLLQHIIGLLKEFSPDRIVVLTFHPEFFRRFGFVETSKETLFPKIYLGCINCTKHKSPLTCPEVAMELAISRAC